MVGSDDPSEDDIIRLAGVTYIYIYVCTCAARCARQPSFRNGDPPIQKVGA